jgi:uncharacterized protein YjbI with pentapeptide repeats
MEIRDDRGLVLYDSKDDRLARDLDSIDLSGHNLRSAVLEGVVLCDSNLRSADLRGSDLYWAVAFRADFRGADLRDSILCGAETFGRTLRNESGNMQRTPEIFRNPCRAESLEIPGKATLGLSKSSSKH